MKTTATLAAALALATFAAEAQEVTLKAVTSFAEKTQFSKNFERFINKQPLENIVDKTVGY